VELARAVFAAHHLAEAHARVCGLFLGGGDLAADLGAEGSWENLLFARSRIVAAAATTGITAIDVPYFKADGARGRAGAGDRGQAAQRFQRRRRPSGSGMTVRLPGRMLKAAALQ
jgi:hypothetical protein